MREKELAAIPPPPPKPLVNLKSAYYVSPIAKYMVKPTQTSTPQRFFAAADLSSIHANETDDSLAILPKPRQLDLIDTNVPEKSFQPEYVVTRRPKSLPEKNPTIEQIQTEKIIHDEIVDDATMNSIVSAMDMSSIAEWHEIEENEEKSTTESNDSFKISIHSIADSFMPIENKTEENCNKNKSQTSNPKTIPTISRSSLIDHSIDNKQPTTESVQVQQEDVSIEQISISSTSISTTLSTTSASISIVNQPKLSVKPKVGFDDTNSIHELSVISEQNVSSQKLVIKGGKWRRTIFEARRNKITECKSYQNILRKIK